MIDAPARTQLTVAETATLLGRSVRSVQWQVKNGLIPAAAKLPGPTGAYLIEAAVVHEILRAQQATPTPTS